MPVYHVTDSVTGLKLKLTGQGGPPTEGELVEIFSKTVLQNKEQREPLSSRVGSALRTTAEASNTIASSMIAEPVAGIAGTVQTLNPFAEEGAGARAVEATREALSFTPRPGTGQQMLQNIGEFVEPVVRRFTDAEESFGDFGSENVGVLSGPLAAAVLKTLPTAVVEGLGFIAVKGGAKAATIATDPKISETITKALPDTDPLRVPVRTVFEEMSKLGVVIPLDKFNTFRLEVLEMWGRLGNPRPTEGLFQAFRPIPSPAPKDVPIAVIAGIRRGARRVAKSSDRVQADIGEKTVDAIDDFMNTLTPGDFGGRLVNDVGPPSGPSVKSFNEHKSAIELLNRAKRSELVSDAVERARKTTSGFEESLRLEFKKLLEGSKTRELFTVEEVAALRRVVNGSKTESLLNLLGKFRIPKEGGSINTILSALGIGGGFESFGPAGAMIMPVIGRVSRNLAKRMTSKDAEFADEVIRAGKDARKITRAYLKHTKGSKQKPEELAELLMRPDIDLENIRGGDVALRAVQIATDNRVAMQAAVFSGALVQEEF